MRVLYISYWGIDDALSRATVMPHIRILLPRCAKLYLATIERTGNKPTSHLPDGVLHIPHYSLRWLPRFLEKFSDIFLFYTKLVCLARIKKVDIIICRGSSAALFGVMLNITAGKAFIVESFEPHADYMLDSKVWAMNSLEFKLQKWVEDKAMRNAQFLLPVTHNYSGLLLGKGVAPERMVVMPCGVDEEKFKFSNELRILTREKLAIPDSAVVGVYAGKFGDIYLREEAFALFREAFDVFCKNFFLIILTPHAKTEIQNLLTDVGFELDHCYIDYVPQESVPRFLSAADFAFSLIRPSPSRRYCSPVKNGEYWANGLPVLLTKGVGDDENIILENRAGVIIDFEQHDYRGPLNEMKSLLIEGRTSLVQRISPLAIQHRSFAFIENAYQTIFSESGVHSIESR